MIENKVIKIVKQNEFDKDYALFSRYDFPNQSDGCKKVLPDDIVRAITVSAKINIILAECRLTRSIVNELTWVSQYIEITLIVKNKQISDYYSGIKFKKIILDETVVINYLGILGKQPDYIVIEESFVRVGQEIEDTYFNNKKIKQDLSFLTEIKEIYFLDFKAQNEYSLLLEECIKRNIIVNYIVGVQEFNKALFERFKPIGANIIVSNRIRDAILYLSNQDYFYLIVLLKNKNLYIPISIDNPYFYTSELYQNLKKQYKKDAQISRKQTFIVEEGKILPLQIESNLVIERTIELSEMADFIEEKFDSSESNNHNEFSSKAKQVTYNFTLIPPTLNPKNDPLIRKRTMELHNSIQVVSLGRLRDAQRVLEIEGLNKKDLYKILAFIDRFSQALILKLDNQSYDGFYTSISSFQKSLKKYGDNLISYFDEIYVEYLRSNVSEKLAQFDIDIENLQKRKNEAIRKIESNNEVLENKIWSESLEKDIRNLEELKLNAQERQKTLFIKDRDAFLLKFNALIEEKHIKEKISIHSLDNLLSKNNSLPIERFEDFMKNYLWDINQVLITVNKIVSDWLKEQIPTDYVIYQQNHQNVIAIEDVKEYFDTLDLQNKYNLHCVRR